MFSWIKKARQDVGAVAGFGKVPALGDFVRAPPRSEEMTAFEEWLTSAMEHAEARRGAAWKDAFARADPLAFLWGGAVGGTPASKTRGLLAGVVVPSRDSVRRSFPIVVCAPLPTALLARAPHLAPLVLVDFFRRAAGAASVAADARSQAEFQAALRTVVAPALDDLGPPMERYQRWARGSCARDLIAGKGSLAQAMKTIVLATLPFKGQEAPNLLLGVRAPLGATAPELAAAAWIDLVRSASGWHGTVPTFFWPLGGRSALIQLGVDAPNSALLDLWLGDPSDRVCDLEHLDPPQSPQAPPFGDALLTALADAEAPLDTLLSAFAAQSPS